MPETFPRPDTAPSPLNTGEGQPWSTRKCYHCAECERQDGNHSWPIFDSSGRKLNIHYQDEQTAKLIVRAVNALSPPPATEQIRREVNLHWLVDWVHLYATEGHSWISTKSADMLIALAARKPDQADADWLKTGTLSALAATEQARSQEDGSRAAVALAASI